MVIMTSGAAPPGVGVGIGVGFDEYPLPPHATAAASAAKAARIPSLRLWPRSDMTSLPTHYCRPKGSYRALDVEHLAQVGGDGARVGVRGHQLLHVPPPPPADLGRGDGRPALL